MIVAGFGFRASASADSLADALEIAAAGRDVDLLATAADKASEPAFATLGARLQIASQPIRAADIAQQRTLTKSAKVEAERSTGSLAEASALAAAGRNARLLGPRVISSDRLATCALAEGEG